MNAETVDNERVHEVKEDSGVQEPGFPVSLCSKNEGGNEHWNTQEKIHQVLSHSLRCHGGTVTFIGPGKEPSGNRDYCK